MNNYEVNMMQFTVAGVTKLTGLPPSEHRKLHSLYNFVRTKPGRDLDLNAVFGTLALSECLKAGFPTQIVIKHLSPLVNEGLTILGSDPLRWRISGAADDNLQFREWMTKVEGPAFRRRVQELLGIQERTAHRFLVLKGAKVPFACDDVAEVLGRDDAAALLIISASALANQIRAYSPDPLFIIGS
ncbi:hypothetical protein [Sphingomonas sp. AX6]|uniref:hypothetical protein n=1 Tax=Sphingomonas sp. AX6 TaxID=2653171 RepID=UPI0012F3AE4C|nr:hypothetical protein [Sphingomonas sp. AX6]VXC84582.1 hypothetical protein SPHINGOAX6_50408 [Sphingomonas sp. AX6]